MRASGKLTPARLKRICDRIAKGAPIRHAALLEGVTDEALRQARAAHPDTIGIAVEQARATGSERRRARFEQLIAKGSSAANSWLRYMATLDPQDYAEPPRRIEQSGPAGTPQQHAVSLVLSVEQALAGARDGTIPGVPDEDDTEPAEGEEQDDDGQR